MKIDKDAIKVIESSLKAKVLFGDPDGVELLINKVPNLNRVISYLNNLAISETFSGDFSKGLGLYNDALNIVGSHDENARHVISYNIALCFLRCRDYESALVMLDNPELSPLVFSEKRNQLKDHILRFKEQNRLEDLYDHFSKKENADNVSSIDISQSPINNVSLRKNLMGVYFPEEVNKLTWNGDSISQKKSA